MAARKLLALAGSVGLTLASMAAAAEAKRVPYAPLLDAAGRPAPGNVVGKGEPHPDAGPDGK